MFETDEPKNYEAVYAELLGRVSDWNFERVAPGLGLVPGVFAGSFLVAVTSGEFRVQGFGRDAPMPRYIAGAMLMGFGSMLAGGCAVGAGVTGGALMASTAWVALISMWGAAGLTDLLVDRPRASRMPMQPAPAIGQPSEAV